MIPGQVDSTLVGSQQRLTAEIQEAEKAGPPPLESLVADVTGYDIPALREQLEDVRPFFEEGRTADGAFPL